MRKLLFAGVVLLVSCSKKDPAPEPAPPTQELPPPTAAIAIDAAPAAAPAPTPAPTAAGDGDAKLVADALAAIPDAPDACEGKACAQLAMASTKTDPSKAMSLFEKGCQTGDGISCAMIGIGLEQGMGVTANAPAAAALYDKSCGLGYGKGCYNLGMMLANGGGVPADLPRAVVVLGKACELEAWRGCGSLGDYYLEQGDATKALPLLQRGCEHEDQLSCDSLAKAKAAAAAK